MLDEYFCMNVILFLLPTYSIMILVYWKCILTENMVFATSTLNPIQVLVPGLLHMQGSKEWLARSPKKAQKWSGRKLKKRFRNGPGEAQQASAQTSFEQVWETGEAKKKQNWPGRKNPKKLRNGPGEGSEMVREEPTKGSERQEGSEMVREEPKKGSEMVREEGPKRLRNGLGGAHPKKAQGLRILRAFPGFCYWCCWFRRVF